MRNLQTQGAIKLRDNMNVVITMAALEEFARDNVVFLTDVKKAELVSVEDHDRLSYFVVKFTVPQEDCGDCCDATDDLSTLSFEHCKAHVQSEDVWYEFTDIYYYA